MFASSLLEPSSFVKRQTSKSRNSIKPIPIPCRWQNPPTALESAGVGVRFMVDLNYMQGFGNEFQSEAVTGALPVGCNSPKRPPLGLYAEQLSGTAFTAQAWENRRTWMYRVLPSVAHGPVERLSSDTYSSILTAPSGLLEAPLAQLRWDPVGEPSQPLNFLEGLTTLMAGGDASLQRGLGVHLFACNQAMDQLAFQSVDGDFLIVPQQGRAEIRTELGVLQVEPGMVAVVQRLMRFSVAPLDGWLRGYCMENYGEHFVLPSRGAIGANGLANARDFETPVASYSDKREPWTLVTKLNGTFFQMHLDHSPFDVVAWHGNYVPYRYDLRRFNTIGSISYDHPDPSIFTVLTSPGARPGVANVDFAIFPDRWMVAENTFRPPYYHRNVMSEFMGLIYGIYDAKEKDGGFVPGGSSLHNAGAAHGPEAEVFRRATDGVEEPTKQRGTMAFMFETPWPYRLSPFGAKTPLLQSDYLRCWEGLAPAGRS